MTSREVTAKVLYPVPTAINTADALPNPFRLPTDSLTFYCILCTWFVWQGGCDEKFSLSSEATLLTVR